MEHPGGHVDEIHPTHAWGWACSAHAGETETVLIRVNDRIFEIKADMKRDDPSAPHLLTSGFRFDFPRELATQSEIEVEIRAKSTGQMLMNGFRSFKNGFARDPLRKIVSQKELFADAFAWLKDSTLEDLNFRLHEQSGAEGASELYSRARRFIETFRKVPTVALALSPDREANVLDFGPGVGWPMQYLLENYDTRVTGIDISENMLMRLKERLTSALAPELQTRFTLQHYEGSSFPLLGGTFDVAVALACLHHIPEEWLYIYFHEFRRVLKPGGLLLGQIMDSGRSYASKADIETEFERRRTKNFGIHPLFYHSREGIQALLKHAGFPRTQFIDGTADTHHYVSFIATSG